jgi:hypothetical protein
VNEEQEKRRRFQFTASAMLWITLLMSAWLGACRVLFIGVMPNDFLAVVAIMAFCMSPFLAFGALVRLHWTVLVGGVIAIIASVLTFYIRTRLLI